MPTEEAGLLWSSLSEHQKITVINKQFRLLQPIKNKQIQLIEELKLPQHKKRGAYFVVFTIIESFWEDVEFILNLGKTKYRYHATPYVRVAFEKMVKIGYLRQQTEAVQEDMAKKEISKIAYRLWEEDIEQGGTGQEGRELYDKNKSPEDSPIDEIKKYKEVDPFPENMEVMLAKSLIVDPKGWYRHYRFLSESEHGGLVYLNLRKDQRHSEYRRSIMILLVICFRVLEWTDLGFNFGMKIEVLNIIKAAAEAVGKRKL